MEFEILGPLEVVDNGRRLTPQRAKQRALLAMLLLHPNEPVAGDLLVDALWGEQPPKTAQTALHGHVSTLRKLLGADRIETQPSGYLLRLDPKELDAERFEALVAEARATEDADERLQRLSAALELWHGGALADFRYERFAQAEIARLEERRMTVREDAIAIELELGRHRELIAELERLVAAQPLRERPRAQLMVALYRSGRQSDALHVFQEGRRVLAEEVGIDPGPTLQELERQVLAQDPALDPPKPLKPAPPRQERKRITVLMAEFSLPRPGDPEDLSRLVAPALGRAREIVASYGGTGQLVFSNALIGIFGAVRTHEDDSERAMRAAAALVAVAREDGRLTVRIGIERGDALVTIEGDRLDVTGDVLADASRLQATAPANQVVLGGAVRRAGPSDALRDEVQFVGREHELALLERTYERAVRESEVQLVTIVGEPGSGKTRLAKELRILLERKEPHAWLEGRCLPYGQGVTFWALGEIVKAEAGILESDDPEMSAQKLSASLAALLPANDDRVWVEANLSPLIGIASTAGTNREQSFAAWRRFLESVAWREPLVLLIEDLHWADPALLDFVDDVVDRAVGVPLLVLCTARLELLDANPGWGGGKRNAATITLPPLSTDETREVARSALGGNAPSEGLVTRAGGNPLFAQELARLNVVEAAPLPDSLQAVIAARLDTLAPQVKEAAMDAAVVGEVFWPGAIAAIGGVDEQTIEEQLHRLVAHDVVRRARTSSVGGQNEYAFLHVLVRDVAYDAIPRTKRAQKHAAAAAWIEQLAGERVVDHAELIAHHYGAALEHARAVGDDREELEARTRRFLVIAADRAMNLDIGAAEHLYRRALELSPEDDPEILISMARALEGSGRLEEAIRTYEEAVAALRPRDDALRLGEALVGLERARWFKSGGRSDLLAEAIRLLEREPPSPELAGAYTYAASSNMVTGRARESLAWAEKAIALASQLRLEHHVVRALQAKGNSRCELGDLNGIGDLREAIRHGLRSGLAGETGSGYANLADWLSWTEGPEAALAHLDEGIDFAERRGLALQVAWLKMNKLAALFDAGRWDELIDLAEELIEWGRDSGESYVTTSAAIAQANVLVRRGAAAGPPPVAGSLPIARKLGDAQVLAPAIVCAALFEVARSTRAAVRLVEELDELVRDLSPVYRALWLCDIERVCAVAGELELGRRLVPPDAVGRRHEASVVSARAILTEAEGRIEEALVDYTGAARRWREHGHALEEGHALLGEGRCLLRLGRHSDAAAPLTEARRIFQRLGARPLLAQVDEHLAEVPAA